MRFRTGDLVTLLSGGVQMTVKTPSRSAVNIDDEKTEVKCSWFEDGRYREEWFNESMLIPAPGDPSPED